MGKQSKRQMGNRRTVKRRTGNCRQSMAIEAANGQSSNRQSLALVASNWSGKWAIVVRSIWQWLNRKSSSIVGNRWSASNQTGKWASNRSRKWAIVEPAIVASNRTGKWSIAVTSNRQSSNRKSSLIIGNRSDKRAPIVKRAAIKAETGQLSYRVACDKRAIVELSNGHLLKQKTTNGYLLVKLSVTVSLVLFILWLHHDE